MILTINVRTVTYGRFLMYPPEWCTRQRWGHRHHGAKAIELYIARQGQRRRRRWKLGTWDLVFPAGIRDGRRRSLYWAKRIAAGTLVFRLAGPFDLIHANLRIVHAERVVVVLENGGIGIDFARLAVKIP